MGSRINFSIKDTGIMRNVTLGLEEAESKKVRLRKALEELHSQSSSVLTLSLQWKELEDHFKSMQNSVLQKYEELQMKENEMISCSEKMEERMKEIRAKEEEIFALFKTLEKRANEVNTAVMETKKSMEQHSLREASIARREKEIEMSMKQIQRAKKRTAPVEPQAKQQLKLNKHPRSAYHHVGPTISRGQQPFGLSHMGGGSPNPSPSMKVKEDGFLALLKSVEDRAKKVTM